MKYILLFGWIVATGCFSFEPISNIDGKLQTGAWNLDVHDGKKYTCEFSDQFTIYDSTGNVLWIEDWHISNYKPYISCNPNLFDETVHHLAPDNPNNPFHALHDHSGVLLLDGDDNGYLYVNQDGTWNMILYK